MKASSASVISTAPCRSECTWRPCVETVVNQLEDTRQVRVELGVGELRQVNLPQLSATVAAHRRRVVGQQPSCERRHSRGIQVADLELGQQTSPAQ
jgi:hypothetical protein